MRRHRGATSSFAALLACALWLAACGGSSAQQLDVAAAASLQRAFERYAAGFSQARTSLSFAGSDALAAQIEQGVRPDVFASANTVLPDALYAKGLVEKPVVFAANRLVIAVPDGSPIGGIAALERPGVTIVAGTSTVPVGRYTDTVLGRLPAGARERVLANLRDREPDVTDIVGRLTEGAAQAGFVYATDVAAAAGRLRAVALPAALQPRVSYAAAVVRGSAHAALARAFIAGLLGGRGRSELLAAGFLAPPAP